MVSRLTRSLPHFDHQVISMPLCDFPSTLLIFAQFLLVGEKAPQDFLIVFFVAQHGKTGKAQQDPEVPFRSALVQVRPENGNGQQSPSFCNSLSSGRCHFL